MASILIIDDDPQIRSLFGQVLERMGHRVLTADSGKEGLRLFRQGSIELVITDLSMRDQAGLEVIMTLRQESPNVPIIAFTGRAEGHESLAVAKYLGARRTIMKAFPVTELIHAVQQELQANERP